MFECLKVNGLDLGSVDSFNNVPEEYRDEFKNAFGDLCEECKKKNRAGKTEEVFKAVEVEITNAKLKLEIIDILNNLFLTYNSMKIIREQEQKEKNQIRILINDIFDKQILRREVSFQQKYMDYNLTSEEELANISKSMWSLVHFYIISRYSTDDIVIDFVEETGLTEETGKIFAENVEKNYNSLQMIVLLDRVKFL